MLLEIPSPIVFFCWCFVVLLDGRGVGSGTRVCFDHHLILEIFLFRVNSPLVERENVRFLNFLNPQRRTLSRVKKKKRRFAS